MKIFFIPSWYPSQDYPIQGVFIKEQVFALAEQYPNMQIGVSIWGRNREDCLLWANQPLKSFKKIYKFYTQQKSIHLHQIKENLHELENPVLIWSERILQGNFKNILFASEKNLLAFQSKVGKIDLIHAQVCHPAGRIAAQLAQKYKIPYIITEQMSPFPFPAILQKNGKLKKNYQQAYQNASANIAISLDLQIKLQDLHIPHTHFIPNLTDEDFFKPSSKIEKSKVFTFFTLARMEAQKDIPTLLYAIQKVLKTQKDIQFRIGGEGTQLKNYQQLATSLGIAENIKWLGMLNRTQALKEFQQVHAFVLSSLHETQGVVWVEAIACGIPIIATRCGGPECIVTPQNGILVEKSNPEALAKAMEKIIQNYANYSPEKIRQDFLERFSKKVITAQIYALYQQVIERGR